MIFAIGLPPARLTAIWALRIARVWIFTKSGIISPRRQPRSPSIGFCSCSDWIVGEELLVLLGRAAGVLGPGDLDELLLEVRQELVERRVDQADDDRQAVHRPEDALEVALLEDLELAPSRRRSRRLLDGRSARAFSSRSGTRRPPRLGRAASRFAFARVARWATRIAPRTISSRSPSRNMCSVRQRPMPWAP